MSGWRRRGGEEKDGDPSSSDKSRRIVRSTLRPQYIIEIWKLPWLSTALKVVLYTSGSSLQVLSKWKK